MSRLPVVIRHDGYTMERPTPAQLIEEVRARRVDPYTAVEQLLGADLSPKRTGLR